MDYETLKRAMERYQDTMTDSERNAAYAKGEEVDRIPFLLPIGEPQADLYGYTLEEYRQSAQVQIDVAEKAQKDFQAGPPAAVAPLGWRGVGHALGSAVVSPEYGLEYISDYVLKDYSMLDALVFDPHTNPVLCKYTQTVWDVRRLTNGQCRTTTRISGPMSVSIAIRKPELFLRDLIKNKKDAHRLLEFSVDCNLKWIKHCVECWGKIAVTMSDPGSACNLISLKMFQEFSKPHLEKLIAGVKELTGSIPGIHICGKTKAIWNELASLGFPSFSVDNCEDLEELKAAVGDKMVISGNVPPITVLKNGTVDDVINAVKVCLRKGSDNPKGFLLQPGCQIPHGTPKENLLAYAYAARRYGRGAKKGQLCRGLIEEGII